MYLNIKRAMALLVIMLGVSANMAAQQHNVVGEQLTHNQQNIIGIASYAAKGDLPNLKAKLHSGLDTGLTVNEIKEVLVHLYAYCGFPRSIRGLQTLMAVLDERKAKGINDTWGPEASPVKDERSKYERGKEILEKLTGAPQDGPKTGYAAFSPEIEILLKEHLFADIFERDILSYADRELTTVSVLSSIGGAEPMLSSHLKICLNVGLTPKQLEQFMHIIKPSLSTEEARSAEVVLEDVLKNNKLK